MSESAATFRAHRRRFPAPKRERALQALAGIAVALVIVGFVPPLRQAFALGVSKGVLAVASPLTPSISNFEALPSGSRIVAADGSVLGNVGEERRTLVALHQLPPHVPRAVLAAEDVNFYEHGGIDPGAVFRAFVNTAQGRTQGGSTITQQLAKLNYTNRERTIFRKLRELLYAVRLEKRFSKDELLERYLNQVYFGDGAYGIVEAAQTFFAVPADRLTPAQAATLAGKIKAPGALDPSERPRAVQVRRDQVLGNMARHGWLTKEQHDEARATPLQVVDGARPSPQAARAPHFVELVKREAASLVALGGSEESRAAQLFTGGYTIETAFDAAAYDAAERTVRSTLGEEGDPATAIVTVKPGDGAITMLFGGLGFDRQFDVASQARRQPGSAFKPFVYLAALRDGIDPRSVMDASSPKELSYRGERYTVDNYEEGQARGQVPIDEALTRSLNTVFAQLILEVGPEDVARVAESTGIPDVNRDPAIALGGLRRGVSPLEMAAAFATFAAKGVYAEPYAIARVKDRAGRVVYSRDPQTRRVFDSDEVGVLNRALLDVVRRGTARAAAIGRPVAGKTGTTQNYRDAWFVGFVPQLSTAVWVGYPAEEKPMTSVHGTRVSGGSFPARIWAGYMRQAVAQLRVQAVFTASPDSLDLRRLSPPPPPVLAPSPTIPTPSTVPTSTTSTTVEGLVLLPPNSGTQQPPSTTTTTAAPRTTSTSTSTTTTSAPSTSTTTTTTTATTPRTSGDGSGSGTGTTTTTEPD